jgi:hypothetical protein
MVECSTSTCLVDKLGCLGKSIKVCFPMGFVGGSRDVKKLGEMQILLGGYNGLDIVPLRDILCLS